MSARCGRVATLIWDARFSLVTALLAGFGRAAAEVGAVIIVGGNIDGFTRTMTTAIALETSKGDLPLAIGLGMVLIAIVIVVNALAWGARRAGERLARDDHARARPRSADRVRRRQRRAPARVDDPRPTSRSTSRRRADRADRAERLRQDHAAARSRWAWCAPTARPRHLGRPRRRPADAARDRVPAPGDAAAQRRRQCPLCAARAGMPRANARAHRANCSTLVGLAQPRAIGRRGGCPAASSSGSRWRARSRAIRRCCFSTSRPRASIPPPPRRSRTSIRAVSGARHQGRDGDARSRRGAAARRRHRAAASRPRGRKRRRAARSSTRPQTAEARRVPAGELLI